VLYPNPLEELTAPPKPLAGLGRAPERCAGGGKSKKGIEAEKRGYLGKKGRNRRGGRETMGVERRAEKGSEGNTCS